MTGEEMKTKLGLGLSAMIGPTRYEINQSDPEVRMKFKLYEIILSKLESMRPCSYEEWTEVLESAGIFWVGDEKTCPNLPVHAIFDPFIKVEDDRMERRTLIVPMEAAIKILALGHLP